MATVNDLRNEIRVAVDRFEREGNTQFTKESLAAIANAVGYPVDKPFPSKDQMRAGILWKTGQREDDDADDVSGAFTKSQLLAIADAVTESED